MKRKTSDSKASSRRKKPKDMPRRPLSSYNLYFREEREKIMDHYEVGKHQADFDVPAMPDSKVPSVIKDHNSVLFKVVARTIADRWKALDSSKKVKYEQLAAAEMVKYKSRMEEYRVHMIKNSEITKRSEKLMQQSIRTLSAPLDLPNASEGSDTTPEGNMSVKLPSLSFLRTFGTLPPGGTGGLGNAILSTGTIPLSSSLNGSPGLGPQLFGGSAFSNATTGSSGVGAGTVQPQQEQQQQHQCLQLGQHFRTLEQLQVQHHRQEQQRRQQELQQQQQQQQQQQHLIRLHPFGSSAPDQGAIEQQLQRMRYATLQQREQDWQRMPGGFARPAEAGGSPMHTSNKTSISSSSSNNNNTLSPSYESLRQQLAGPYQPPVGDVMRQARQQEEQLLRQQQQRVLQSQQALQQHQATTIDILRAQQAHQQQGLPSALAAATTTAIDVMRAQQQQQTTSIDVMRAQQQQQTTSIDVMRAQQHQQTTAMDVMRAQQQQQTPQAQMKVWQPQLQEQALEAHQREVLLLLQAQQQEDAAQHRKASLMESIELELNQQQQQQGGAMTSPMPPPSLPSLVRGATP